MLLSKITLLRSTGIISLLTAAALLVNGCTPPEPPKQPSAASAAISHLPLPPSGPAANTVPTLAPTSTPVSLNGPVTVAIATDVPEEYATELLTQLTKIDSVKAANGEYPVQVLDVAANADTQIRFTSLAEAEFPLAERFFAAVTPFDTVADSVSLEELQTRWQGLDSELGNGEVLFAGFNPGVLDPILGPSKARQVNRAALLGELEGDRNAIAILPFDQLDPRFKVLAVDGVSVLDNHLEPASYPLAVALDITGHGAPLLHRYLAGIIEPVTNRDADRLTSLIMTGVTAISRGTAAAIERTSLTYPADVISDTLRAADITHVSNEVPFLHDCVVNNTYNNIVLCSHNDYSATLMAIGTDIVGLSGNHVNDFGREGARESLMFYRANHIPIYGSGFDVEDACKPLQWEDHGNTFAFIAALAYDPEYAWATEDEPGACYFYDNKDRILASIRELADEVDIVSVELQYAEEYDPHPLPMQVVEFRELRDAGADIVTGVQSHVPQAMEPYGDEDPGGPGIIVYGLGNLFFDQMWSWATRTGLIARHTIYDGRVISTEVLTTVLEDYAQPRWATEEERTGILREIFNAAPSRPDGDEG
ncbi:MAG: CapA family protein [Caldilineaceae bacterium]|jgi:hypothetical protein